MYNGLNTTGWDTSNIRVWALEMALRGNGFKSIHSFIQTWPNNNGWRRVNFDALKEPPIKEKELYPDG